MTQLETIANRGGWWGDLRQQGETFTNESRLITSGRGILLEGGPLVPGTP